jgi:hypothetical protein
MENTQQNNKPKDTARVNQRPATSQLHVPTRKSAGAPCSRTAHRMGNVWVSHTDWVTMVQRKNMGGSGTWAT